MPTVSGFYSQSVNWAGTAVAGDGSHSNAAPSLATDGMDINDCTGFRVIVSADSGQTLSGAGTVRLWLYSTSLSRWVHDSTLDYTLNFASATWRDDVSPDFECKVGYGRVYAQLVNVTSSSGNVTPQTEGGVLK